MTYVYILSEKFTDETGSHELWTVGFYDPAGKFQPESDHPNKQAAADRVHWLHGGIGDYELQEITQAAAMFTGMHR